MSQISCKYPNPDPTSNVVTPKLTRLVSWRLFYPKCSKLNQLCAGGKPAYLCAMTVCRQQLW